MGEGNKKISFADLDGFLKFAPIIGIGVLAYLQTLFPSKVEFEKLEDHLIQMDKKITEMSVMQSVIDGNSRNLSKVEERVRELEIAQAKRGQN